MDLSNAQDSMKFLQENATKIERFTLYGIQTYGKIVSIYDGDTFDMSFILPSDKLTKEHHISKKKKGTCLMCQGPETCFIMRTKCRLNGYRNRIHFVIFYYKMIIKISYDSTSLSFLSFLSSGILNKSFSIWVLYFLSPLILAT